MILIDKLPKNPIKRIFVNLDYIELSDKIKYYDVYTYTRTKKRLFRKDRIIQIQRENVIVCNPGSDEQCIYEYDKGKKVYYLKYYTISDYIELDLEFDWYLSLATQLNSKDSSESTLKLVPQCAIEFEDIKEKNYYYFNTKEELLGFLKELSDNILINNDDNIYYMTDNDNNNDHVSNNLSKLIKKEIIKYDK